MNHYNERNERSEKVLGCLLGGAVGDALGAPVEFMNLADIRRQFGPDGIQHYAPAYGRLGAVTDDTQMTLFTLEGIIRARNRYDVKGFVSIEGCVLRAYLRWLGMQGFILPKKEPDWIYTGWLWQQKQMHSRRAPGATCLASLQHHLSKFQKKESHDLDEPLNNSKGCGGVMRMAPVGFFRLDWFRNGCELARLTHGHPSGYLAAGFFANLIGEIMEGSDLNSAIESSKKILMEYDKHQEVLDAVEKAVAFVGKEEAVPETIEKLGEGWVAEEALAISLFCSMTAKDFAHGIRLAVNHSGDSDSTGAITCNILGALLGRQAIPGEFLKDLELRDIIEEMSKAVDYKISDEESMTKYPPN